MGISSALDTALAGLRLSQNGLNLVAQNIASANVPGYTRKVLQPVSRVAGGQVIGVDTDSVSRVLDTLLQRQLRIESSGGTYTDVRSQMMQRVDGLFGTPGDANALDTIYHNFTNSLSALVTSPESSSARDGALQNAQVLTTRLNGISSDIQDMRSEAEQGIASSVSQANDLLNQLTGLDQQIVSASATSSQPVQLLDQRDQILDSLSKLMDIKVTQNQDNSVTIYTGSGVLLFDRQPALLQFDQRANLQATSVYSSDPSKRSVGTITLTTPSGYTADLVAQNAFRSGAIAGYLSLRDQLLPQMQANLDEFASGISLALSQQTVASTPITSAGLNGQQIDLAQLQSGDSITLSVTSNGVPRTVTIVRVDDPSKLPISADQVAGTSGEVFGVDFSNLGNAATAIGSILGPGFTVSNPSGTLLNVLDDGAAATTDVNSVNATISSTSLTSGEAALPFFVDSGRNPPYYTASVDGGVQKIGFAGRIGINPDLVTDPSKLVNMSGSASFNGGDATRPSLLLDQLTANSLAFAPSAGLNAVSVSGTADSYLQRILNNVGQQAQTAKQLADGQATVVNGLQDRFAQSSKVNIDDEMANLIELQQTYQASAHVLATANAMLQQLMTISTS